MILFCGSTLLFFSGVIFGYTRMQDALWQANAIGSVLIIVAIMLLAYDFIEGR